jgi:hypothetical protein
VVTDSGGGYSAAQRAVTVNNPLLATFTSPSSGATVSGTTSVGMSASGGAATGSRSFTFKIDSVVVSTQTVSGTTATYSWPTGSVADGAHTLVVVVTDSAGGRSAMQRSVTVANGSAAAPGNVWLAQAAEMGVAGGPLVNRPAQASMRWSATAGFGRRTLIAATRESRFTTA